MAPIGPVMPVPILLSDLRQGPSEPWGLCELLPACTSSRGWRRKDAVLCHLLTRNRANAARGRTWRPLALWFSRGGGLADGRTLSDERSGEAQGPGHGQDLPAQPPRPSAADAVPSDRLACETLNAP